MLYWIRYQNAYHFSPDVYWTNEIDNRRFVDPDVQHQFIIHSRLHVKRGAFDYATGLTMSNAYAQRPELGYSTVVTEIRPVVEVNYEARYRSVSVFNRIRIDNRFVEDGQENIWKSSRYVMRLRYRLQARFNLEKISEQAPGIRAAWEVMVNSKENLFDQHRTYLTLDWKINRNMLLETGYIFIYQQRFATEDIFERHVLRLSILHKVGKIE